MQAGPDGDFRNQTLAASQTIDKLITLPAIQLVLLFAEKLFAFPLRAE